MQVFVKKFRDYRTIKNAVTLSHTLVLDSLKQEKSTVTVKGTAIGRSNTGDWLLADGRLFVIQNVKPTGENTVLTLLPPLDAFSRKLQPGLKASDQSVGQLIKRSLEENWTRCPDPVYAVPYLSILNEDQTPVIAPTEDLLTAWSLPEYCRKMRKLFRIRVSFRDVDSRQILCRITVQPEVYRQILFEDGHSTLQTVDYASDGISKATVIRNTEAGGKIKHEEETWYLAADGGVSMAVPEKRAPGRWELVEAKGKDPLELAARAAFAKNKYDHRITFLSDKELSVGEICGFNVYGDILVSAISCKTITSGDSRALYKSGQLAVRASEKLKGEKA